jgi:hypothetical protein
MYLVEITAISWVILFFEGDCSNLGAGAQGQGGEEEALFVRFRTVSKL